MKKNFLASVDQDFWRKETKAKVILDPFVPHFLEANGIATDADFERLDFLRQNRTDLEADFRAVESKYEKYLPVLAAELDRIHGMALGEDFWRRALGLGLYRHITFLYDSYRNYRERFSPDRHEANVLAAECYVVMRDYAEQRELLEHSLFGQEQLFSLYVKHFHAEDFWPKAVKIQKSYRDATAESTAAPSRAGLKARLNYVVWQLRAAKRDKTFLRFAKNKILRRFFFKDADITLAIVESFFAPEHILTLENESGGRIRSVALPNPPRKTRVPLNEKARASLAGVNFNGMDEFDGFFFRSLPQLLPTLYVEEFREHFDFYDKFFARFPNLKSVTCESFSSSSQSALALAVIRHTRGIRHLYNEHNCLVHQFLGGNYAKAAKLVDRAITLGWKLDSIPNLVPGASLFRFQTKLSPKKDIPLLYIGGPAYVRTPEFSSAYGFCAEKAPHYLEFITRFFRALPTSTKQKIYYRGYPAIANGMVWNVEHVLRHELPHFVRSEIQGKLGTAKDLMGRARLIIVDYLSTTYLESLRSDIPTVFFWDQDAYYLNEEFGDFYDGLVRAGICQTNPEAAARFIESIKDNPEAWWNQPATQKAKNEFLAQNFGKPEKMLSYLLTEARVSNV